MKMKRFIIACLLLSFIVPVSVEAKRKMFGNGFSFELSDDGVLVISGNGRMPKEGRSLWSKYKDKGKIHKIIIEEGITSIASYAFQNFVNFDGKTTKENTAIKEVVLPNSLEEIEYQAFEGNLKLDKIRLGSNLIKIGSSAFANCGLLEVYIPNSVTEIGEWAFSRCRNLRKVVLSTRIQEIKSHTFIWCYNLRDISIPKNVKSIGEAAFGWCEQLQEIILPDGIERIEKDAFYRYDNPIRKVSIPASTKSIGHKAFALIKRVGGATVPYKCEILSLPSYIDRNNCMEIGLSEESVGVYKKANTPDAIIKRTGNYASVLAMFIDGTNYYKVNRNGHYGLTDSKGKIIVPVEMETIEPAGVGYVRYKKNGAWGVSSVNGKEIIPTIRNYTYISSLNKNDKTFAFTKKGFTGTCDTQGREISLTRLAPTVDDIKANGNYASAVEMKNGSTKYYKVSKNGRYGMTDAEGKIIVPVEMEALESAGTGYLRYKLNGFWGLMNYQGKVLIDTNRGYTSIGDYKSFNKRFAYTMNGYKGECDATGKQISKIKVDTPRQNTSVASSSSSSSSSSSTSSSSGNNSSGNKTTTVVVEHHRDPVPVQVWKQCTICFGSGKCQTCGGTGIFTGWSGNSSICEYGCGGSGKCSFCAGHGGHYEVEYR